MKDTIQLVTWKGTVKKYGYKESKNKGTRFGIELRLDGEDDVRFIWCDSNLQRKTIVKRMMSIGAAEDRPFNLID